MLVRTIIFLFAVICSAQAAETISGKAHVIDGDTLAIGETKIRLEGIDAPESDQTCLDRNAAKWSCGIATRDRLIQHGGRPTVIRRDQGDRKRSHKRERTENSPSESTGGRLCERPSNTGQSAKRICGHG